MIPFRFTILQCSQSFLTDARTFISNLVLTFYPPFRHVERRHFYRQPVTRSRFLHLLQQAPRRVGQNRMAVGQFQMKQPSGQSFGHDAFNFDGIFSGHVKISGSPSVTNTVCSK